jgi:hypothetical protein
LPYTVRYAFSQSFKVPAREAFAWCTDYAPDDFSRLGGKGKRSITKVAENSLLLEDYYAPQYGRSSMRKKKIVHIYPEKMFWSSVHLSGPILYSQFLYQIVSRGKNGSRIDFTGFQVMRDKEKASKSEISRLARKLTEEDSLTWKNLARAMENELRVRG